MQFYYSNLFFIMNYVCTAVIVAFALIVDPLAMSEDALAKNKAKQSISQYQSSH